jgi:hypothetical protein
VTQKTGPKPEGMKLPPEVIAAMQSQCEAMGFKFQPEAISGFAFVPNGMELLSAMGLSSEEMARMLLERFTVLSIERHLPTCVDEQFDGRGAMISMPLDDLRFIYGYLALVEAGARTSPDQTKRAMEINDRLVVTAIADAARAEPPAPVKKRKRSKEMA